MGNLLGCNALASRMWQQNFLEALWVVSPVCSGLPYPSAIDIVPVLASRNVKGGRTSWPSTRVVDHINVEKLMHASQRQKGPLSILHLLPSVLLHTKIQILVTWQG